MHEWDNGSHCALISYALGKKKYLLKFLCIEIRRLNELIVKLIGSEIDIERKLTFACTGFVELHI